MFGIVAYEDYSIVFKQNSMTIGVLMLIAFSTISAAKKDTFPPLLYTFMS